MKKNLFLFAALATSAIFFTSCNDDDDNNTSVTTATGPSSSAAFTGATVSFNPSITFLANGQISYVNEESGSQFELAPASDPLEGTFDYVPAADFLSGSFTYTFPGLPTETVSVSNFVTVNGLIRGFKLTFDTEGIFDAVVTAGSIQAATPPPSTPGSGSTTGGESFTFGTNGNIVAGTTFTKTFLANGGQGDITLSPLKDYAAGATESFSIATNGNIEFAGKTGTISLPFRAASDGIVSWSSDVSTGGITVVFDTKPTSAASDLTVTWNGNVDFTNPTAIAIDGKVFSN